MYVTEIISATDGAETIAVRLSKGEGGGVEVNHHVDIVNLTTEPHHTIISRLNFGGNYMLAREVFYGILSVITTLANVEDEYTAERAGQSA